MPYHVSLDLTSDQVKKLKHRAVAEGTSVRELVTVTVQRYLDDWSDESAAGSGSRGKESAKTKTIT